MLELNQLMLKEIVGGDGDCECICTMDNYDLESDGVHRIYHLWQKNLGLMSKDKCKEACDPRDGTAIGWEDLTSSYDGYVLIWSCK